MIATRQAIGPSLEHCFDSGAVDAAAMAHVLDIHDHEVGREAIDQARQFVSHDPAPRFAEHVADGQQFHGSDRE
jgi:hypothetical protein